MSVAWQCEIDPYCRAVIAHHWPGVVCYDDIRSIDDTAERVDLICGGFPCQPVSLAGKGLAQEDPRWLWPEFARVVGLLRPRYVLVENVPGLVRRGLADVVGDLAALGYDAEWQVVSAASVGAPHLRERIFIVAYPDADRDRRDEGQPESHGEAQIGGEASEQRHHADGLRDALAHSDGLLLDWGGTRWQDGRAESSDRRSGAGVVGDANGSPPDSFTEARTPRQATGESGWWSVEPDVGRVAHGVPNRLAQLRALGNAVVPQVAEFVGRLILEAEGAQLAA